MAFFEWKESFNLGVAEIDRQHRDFLEYLNQLYDLSPEEKKAPVTKEVIERLRRHAETHFEFEAKLFEVIGFTEKQFQDEQHDYFMLRVNELSRHQRAGNVESLNSVLSFLRDWFLNHILEADRKYIPFMEAVTKK